MTGILRSVLLGLIVVTTLAGDANANKSPQLNLKYPKDASKSIDLTGGGSSIHAVNVAVPAGVISGKVTRDDGLTPIPGVTVKALQGTTTIATTTTDGTGDYTLSQLPAGTYTVEASAAGFGTKSQSLVTVTENGATSVNLKLDAIVSGPVSYIYDALGRLVATVGPAETTVYTYDAVGNLLSISRQPSSQLSIISVVPNRGSVGQMVTIYGTGFSAVPSQNTVEFGGTAATIISATATRIVTTVPSLGITGQVQVSVTTSQGTVSAPFMVLPGSSAPSIQVSPQYVSILPGDTLQFFATVTGLSGNQSVSWSVNGVNSGNSDLGTISAAGFYSSPNRPNSIFTIRATSVADPAVFGQAQVGVLNPSQSEAVISPSTSVFRRPPIDSAPHTALSVRRRSSDSVASITPGVSVRRLVPSETGTPMATAVSVRRWPPVENGSPQSPNLSITTGPIIQSVAPASAGKGTVVTLTITGANLGGVTALSFLTTAGAIDSTITASSITVNGNGTELTATVTISTGTAVGQRVVVVVTPTSHSLAVTAGANVLEIVQ